MLMRTTIIIKDDILKEAMRLSKIKEKTALVHAGLEALIQNYVKKRLIALGGADKSAKASRRRRF